MVREKEVPWRRGHNGYKEGGVVEELEGMRLNIVLILICRKVQ